MKWYNHHVMNRAIVRKKRLHDPDERDDLKGKSPEELMGMVWQMTKDAWSFREGFDAESRLQRHVVVLKKRRG